MDLQIDAGRTEYIARISHGPDGHTVHDYDLRFRLEDEGLLIPGDPRFRWKQLDEDLQYNLL